MRYSILIPTLRRGAILHRTLESLLRCDPCPLEVIVIDGDPERAVRETVEELAARTGEPEVRYVASDPGLAVQRNRGIDEARGDVVLFLDDDVEIHPRLLEHLAEAYADESVVGATGRVVEPDPHRRLGVASRLRRWLPGGGEEGTFTRFGYPRYLLDPDRECDVEFMRGCFMSARREAAKHIRFDDRLGHYALAEDEDFSYRLSRLGRIRYLPRAVVNHKKLGFSSKDSREFGRLVVRNRAYLFRKNFPQTLLARTQFALFVALLLAHRAVNREWRAVQGVAEGAAQLWWRRA